MTRQERIPRRMGWNTHWRTRRAVSVLEQTIDQQRTIIIQLRRKLTTKEAHAAKLEVVVRQRTQTIDDLRGKLEWARKLNKRLDAENEHLCELVRLSP